jgi:putative DNA primase/helicase
MADFAQWGFAVAPSIRWSAEDFDRAYRANRNEAFEAAIEDDPIAPHILSLLEGRAEKSWQGTTEQLWIKIKAIAGEAACALNFPRSAVALGKALRRIEPALAARGVVMERSRVSVGSWVSLRATA